MKEEEGKKRGREGKGQTLAVSASQNGSQRPRHLSYLDEIRVKTYMFNH